MDGVAGDVEEDDVSDIADGAAGLKADDGTIVSEKPIEPVGSGGVGLLVLLLQAKDEFRRLEKENEELTSFASWRRRTRSSRRLSARIPRRR